MPVTGHPAVWSVCVLSALIDMSIEGLGRGWGYGADRRWTSMSKCPTLGLFSNATLDINQRNDVQSSELGATLKKKGSTLYKEPILFTWTP